MAATGAPAAGAHEIVRGTFHHGLFAGCPAPYTLCGAYEVYQCTFHHRLFACLLAPYTLLPPP